MGGFIDWTPLRNPGFINELTDPLVAAAKDYADRRAARERQDKELVLRREQEARLNARDDARHQEAVTRQNSLDEREKRRLDMEEARGVGARTLTNVAARTGATNKAFGALANGQESIARQTLGNYAEADPKTGAVTRGIPFERLLAPQPTMPEFQEGPLPSPQDMEAAAQHDADPATALTHLQANTEAMRASQSRAPVEMQKFNLAKTEMERADAASPRYRIDGNEVGQQELRHAKSDADAGDFEAQVGPSAVQRGGDGQTYAKMLAGEIRGGGVSPAQASQAWNAYLRDGTKMDFTSKENQLNRESRERIQAMKPPPAGSKVNGDGLDFKAEKLRQDNLRRDLKLDLQNYNAKTTREAAFEFPNITDMLKSGNGRLQDQALITMMRLAQKDNRFSDADAKLAMRAGAGWLDQVESGAHRLADGSIDGQVLANALNAAEKLNGYYQNKNAEMNQVFESYLHQPEFYNPRDAEQLIGRVLPGWSEKHAANRKDGTKKFTPDGIPLTGAPEDVDSEAPLPEDPQADSIDSLQPPEVRQMVGTGRKKAAAPAPKTKLTREEAIREAKRRGLIP